MFLSSKLANSYLCAYIYTGNSINNKFTLYIYVTGYLHNIISEYKKKIQKVFFEI